MTNSYSVRIRVSTLIIASKWQGILQLSLERISRKILHPFDFFNSRDFRRFWLNGSHPRTFARKFSNIDFFLKILPLKDDELLMSEM